MRAHEARLRQAVAELVQARRAGAAAGEDLLARLLRASDAETGQSMSDELLVDNIVSFLMAGYDTTAFALTWTLYLISKSPEWEARMLQEVEQVVGSGPVTSAHVEHLVTVQQVLNESLRLFPTAPIIVRDIVDDIEFDGVSIPAGTIGIIPIYAIHRHRNYWDDPDRFDPNRFARDSRSKPTRFQFMPFGAGPRICIGAAFAMIEATIMLATFVRAGHFEVSPDFDPQPSARMFLLPKNGMPMRVTLRGSAR
jgi:cytochrome P450